MAKSCFVISSIGPPESNTRKSNDEKFDFFIKPVLEEMGYDVIRSDKINNAALVSIDIITRLISADLVIADISEANPNVFYELAIRNVVNKPVIIIKKPDESVPFDIKDKRAISVDMKRPGIWLDAKKMLEEQVESSEKNPKVASASILSSFHNILRINSDSDENNSSFIFKTMAQFPVSFSNHDFTFLLLHYNGKLAKDKLISMLNDLGRNGDNHVGKKIQIQRKYYIRDDSSKIPTFELNEQGIQHVKQIIKKAIDYSKKLK